MTSEGHLFECYRLPQVVVLCYLQFEGLLKVSYLNASRQLLMRQVSDVTLLAMEFFSRKV